MIISDCHDGADPDGHGDEMTARPSRESTSANFGYEAALWQMADAFDEQPMPELDPEALDFRAASESFASVFKLVRRDLESVRLVTDHQGRKCPTVGRMLLFGAERERHFPDAWIHGRQILAEA